jgi:hypothetical protein
MSAEGKTPDPLDALMDTVQAQTVSSKGHPEGTNPSGWTADYSLNLAVSILLFGLIIFSIMAWLLSKRHDHMAVLKVCALPLIIVSAMFLVIVGYSAEQIAPVLGLMGSIAGYLLGSVSKQTDHSTDPAPGGSPGPGQPPSKP